MKRVLTILFLIILTASTFASIVIIPSAKAATPPPVTTQNYSIGTGAYPSNYNVAYYSSDLAPLINPRLTFSIDQNFSNTDNLGTFGANAWSMQLNCHSPTGFTTGFEQFVIADLNGVLYADIAFIQPNDFFLGQSGNVLTSKAPFPMAAGWKFDMTVHTDPLTHFTIDMQVTLFDPSGNSFAQVTTPVSILGNPLWNAPISACHAELVGIGTDANGKSAIAAFTSGAGSFSYYPSGGQTYSWVAPIFVAGINNNNMFYPFPVGLTVANVPKYPGGNKQHTSESSNIGYAAVATSTVTTQTQTSTSAIISNSSEPLQFVTGNISKTSKQTGFGKDIGPTTFEYSSKGMTMTISNGAKLTIGLPQVTLGLSLITLVNNFVKNRSEYAIQSTGVGSSLTTHFKNTTEYDKKELLISGTGNMAGKISIQLSSASRAEVCDMLPHFAVESGHMVPACTQASFGGAAFDWSDSLAFSPSYNNVTHVLTYTVGTSFKIDPLALDGSGTCDAITTATNCAATVTTANTNDVLYCTVEIEQVTGGQPNPSVSTVTDNKGNTWAKRVQAQYVQTDNSNRGTTAEGWFTTWSGSGAVVITVTSSLSAAENVEKVVCFGVSGANTAVGEVFDPNASIPAKTSSTTGVNSLSLTISTTNANDFLLVQNQQFAGGGMTTTLNACHTLPTSFTYMTGDASGLGDHGVAYRIVSAAQSSVTETWSWTSANPCFTSSASLIFDAICRSGDCATVAIAQTKSCTFVASTSPTCAFTYNTPVGDVVAVAAADSVSTVGVSTVTDSASNSYTVITNENVLTAVGDNTMYCSNTATAGVLTVTVNYGAAATGTIIMRDYRLAAASCATTGSDDSSGRNALSTTPSVASYTPSSSGSVFAILNSGCQVACTVTAGNGYTMDVNGGIGASLQASSEYIANSATAETSPFTISVSSAWNEISVTFVLSAETRVTQPFTCTMDNSGTQQTLTLTGGNPSPSQLSCTGISVNVTVDKSSTITEIVPVDATNTRARFSTTVQTRTTATCAAGTCTADTFTLYFQLQNTYQATPNSPATWDAVLSITVIGTLSGVGSTTGCTITTANGGGAASCQTWFDYNRLVTLLSPIGGWTGTAPTTFSDTTGGNTDNVNYGRGFLITNTTGLTLTYTASGVSGLTSTGSVTVDTGTSLTVAGAMTCTYKVQNASFVYQFVPSGIQLYSAAAATNVNDFTTANVPPRVTFTETGHVIMCIPTGATFTTDKIFANNVQVAEVFSSPNLFFVGTLGNEVDFFPPTTYNGGPAPTVPAASNPVAQVMGPLTAILAVSVVGFLALSKKKKNVHDPPSQGKTVGNRIDRPKTHGENLGHGKVRGQDIKRPKINGRRHKRPY